MGRHRIFVSFFFIYIIYIIDDQEETEEEEQFVFVEFLGLPDPSILRQKGICTMLV